LAALTRSLLAVAVVVLAGACGSGAPSSGVHVAVVDRPPAGYERGPGGLNGRYAIERVAEASPTRADEAVARLRLAGFRGAEGRLFRRGGAYAVLIVVEAADARRAETLARTDAAATSAMFGTASWSPDFVPDAVGYLFNGRYKGAVVFCQGAWLWHGPYAVHGYTCDERPGTVAVLEELLRSEHELLVGGSLPGP
jgi:hypothetical protein